MRTILVAAVLGALSLQASAALFTFGNEFSGGVDCANVVSGCGTLEVTASGADVHFKLTGTMTGTEFITGLYGNIDPFVERLPTGLAGTGLDAFSSFAVSQDAYKADGDGYFDWLLELSSNPPRFDGVDVLEWTLSDLTLAQAINGISVNGPADKTGFSFALHAQGLVNGGSGWFNGVLFEEPPPPPPPPPSPNPVPEPGSLALVMLAGVLAGAFRTRRR